MSSSMAPDRAGALGASPAPRSASAHPPIALRDVAVAVGYGVLAVVLAQSGVANSGFVESGLGWGVEVSLPLMLVAALATLWRRRAPAVTFTVTGALSLVDTLFGGQITAYVLLFEALFTPVVHGSRRLARTATFIAGALSLLAMIAAAVLTGSVELVLVVLIVVALVALTPLLWGWEVRHHREARRTAEALAQAHQDLAASRSARAVEGERRRIAHDLHDVIAGHLSAVSLHTSLASALEDRNARDASLQTARDSAKAALRDLQSMIKVLSTEEPGTLPQATLGWEDLAARLRGRDPEARVVVDEAATDPEQVDPSVQAALLRIAAEAVTNAVRHGQAPISLHVTQGLTAEGQVHLQLTNRIGESAEPGTGLGVGALGHRAEAVGGTAQAGPLDTDPGMWQVQAQLPARAATALPHGTPPPDPSPSGALGRACPLTSQEIRA